MISKGIAYLESGKLHYTEKRQLISDLDSIPFRTKVVLIRQTYASVIVRLKMHFLL